MNKVFIVTHTNELPNGHEDIKFIGVYDSYNAASEAVTRASLKPGFSENQEGFFIENFQIGKDHWTEGFLTYIPDDDKE